MLEAKHKLSDQNYAIKIIKLPVKDESQKKVRISSVSVCDCGPLTCRVKRPGNDRENSRRPLHGFYSGAERSSGASQTRASPHTAVLQQLEGDPSYGLDEAEEIHQYQR